MAHEHFDQHAPTWDLEPRKTTEARLLADAIAAALPLTGRDRLLEYGAGTGLVSQALVPRVGPVTLADNSAGMRGEAQAKVADGRLPAGTRIWDLDLETGAVPGERFDLLVCSLVLHHVHDIPRVLRGFRTLLAPGGHLAIADLDTEDGSFHAQLHDFDGHPGFDRDQLVRWLAEAGFADIAVRDCLEIEKEGATFPVFLATAGRPATTPGSTAAG
jgi:ubiquinone/menaquinone biosynthesis C-methylase UbiE